MRWGEAGRRLFPADPLMHRPQNRGLEPQSPLLPDVEGTTLRETHSPTRVPRHHRGETGTLQLLTAPSIQMRKTEAQKGQVTCPRASRAMLGLVPRPFLNTAPTMS